MDVLESRRAILDIGRRQLIFPREGEWEYQLPPGSTVTPLARAPSGHLCMVIDEFHAVPPAAGIAKPLEPLRKPKPVVEEPKDKCVACVMKQMHGTNQYERKLQCVHCGFRVTEKVPRTDKWQVVDIVESETTSLAAAQPAASSSA